MTATSQNFEEKVHEDFMYFLEHFIHSFDTLKSAVEREICQKWLDKLAVEKYTGIYEQQMRNIYMSRLVLCMNSKRFTPPFHAPPILAALSLDGVFTEITTRPFSEVDKENKMKENKKEWSRYTRNRELEMVELNHMSKDGRTYAAFKTLPENSGIFAYIAVSVGADTDCNWVNSCGQPISAPAVTSLDLKVESSKVRRKNNLVEGDKLYQMNAQVRSIMSKRKSPEARKSTYEFFKTLYNSIEQEMLREEDPNSTACRDPYVEKLLENLLNDSRVPCNKWFNPELFKRLKMLSLLKKRVKNILCDIEERTKYLSEVYESSVAPKLNTTNATFNCLHPVTKRAMQWSMMEQPTRKIANELTRTYPHCLVKKFLELTMSHRQKMIKQFQEKTKKITFSMKRELKDEIIRGLQMYKLTRKEWMDVMSVKLRYDDVVSKMIKNQKNNNQHDENRINLTETLLKEVKNKKKQLEIKKKNNRRLREAICSAENDLYELKCKDVISRMQDELCEQQNDITEEKNIISDRVETIKELQQMLKALTK